jgi:hypothetical protein
MDVFKIKKGDTDPALAVTMQYANGSAVDLNGGSVWFNMGNITSYAPYVSGQCIITGSTDGMCEYRWSNGQGTGSIGKYWAEFEFQIGGSRLTLPNDHNLKIEVYEDYN